MLEISEIIAQAQQKGASDIHIVTGLPVKCRIDGKVQNLTEKVLTWEDCEYYAKCLADDLFHEIECIGELDLARTFPCGARTRINLFRQQGAVSAAIRILADTIPEIEALNLPPVVSEFPEYRSGIILVTGETGSGKSIRGAATSSRWKTRSSTSTSRISASLTSARSAKTPEATQTACGLSCVRTRTLSSSARCATSIPLRPH